MTDAALEEGAPPGSLRWHAPLAERARQSWRKAAACLDARSSAHLRGAWVLAELHLALMDRLESREFEVGRERVGPRPLRELVTAWRAARRAGRT